MSTGTTATGFVLLRVIDPEFELRSRGRLCTGSSIVSPFYWRRRDHNRSATACPGTSFNLDSSRSFVRCRYHNDYHWQELELAERQLVLTRD